MIHTANPLRKVKSFKVNNTRVRYLSRDEIATLLAATEGVLRDIVQIALNTGMRRGEIQKIRRKDINFSNNVLAITDQKNGETSYLPMNRMCRQILSKYRDIADNDRPFGYDFSSTFDRIIRKLKIPNFRFHDLRHTFASSLVMSGIDLNTVRELLRHKSLAMTLRYAHLAPGFKQTAVERLDTYWTPDEKLAGSEGPAARRNPLQPLRHEKLDLRRVGAFHFVPGRPPALET